jgi:glycosyltransferase involved in cell wall biosynthesis
VSPSHFARGVARAARDPGTAARVARARSWSIGLTWSRRLPIRIHRSIFTVLGGLAGAFQQRRGDHPIAVPVRMVALIETGRPDEAIAVARDADADLSLRTAARLARIALSVQRPDVADELLARVDADASPDPTGSIAELRGDIDLELGRYTSALGCFSEAARRAPGRADLARKAARVRGQLTIMDPAWRPPTTAYRSVPRAERHRGRILHLLSISLPYSQVGYTVRTQDVARCQQAAGLDPRMVTRAGFPGNKGRRGAAMTEELDGVTYQRIRPDLERGLPVDRIAAETATGLAELVGSLRPAVLQPATSFFQGQVALAVGEQLDLPVVYEVRGFLEESWRSHRGEDALASDRYVLARAVETECMRRATAIVSLSETMRAEILSRGGIDAERVVVIPNAVDVERFRPGPRDEALAAALGIGADETVVGYISTLNGYEGIHHLVAAVGELRRRGRRVRLLVVGDGDERPNLEAAAAEEGMLADGGALFTGRVPYAEIQRYYRTIDIFVVPRTNARVSQLVTPLKPFEAMAMAKTVIISGVGALLEMVRDGETGRTFPPDDQSELLAVIDSLLDDPAERRRLGAAAREWVAANRTWQQNGRRYLELFQRLDVA